MCVSDVTIEFNIMHFELLNMIHLQLFSLALSRHINKYTKSTDPVLFSAVHRKVFIFASL